MELLFNELSIHGQFFDPGSFRDAIQRVMVMRQTARRFGREVYCHRNMAFTQVTPTLALPGAIKALAIDERRALMQWLQRQGPFWEDVRIHGPDDYLEIEGRVVTDSAVGEAAFCCFHGMERQLVSLVPSLWQFSPVLVTWILGSEPERAIEVRNHWDPDRLEAVLQAAPVAIVSWSHLESVSLTRFPDLTFLPGAFEPLQGHPFFPSAAERILVILDTLHRFKRCHTEHGPRTAEGQRLYHDHFTGEKAWFSDSSDSDKHEFRDELTFPHPVVAGESLFCPWHGKVKTPQIRIHFSWPVRADTPLYVVYVGPKITKH